MSKKPETRFYTAVHKALPPDVYREKFHNMYRGGTPDCWYSGSAADLWVEYKWIARLNKRAPIDISQSLSPLQLRWLGERYEEGRNVVVILGTPEGAWVFEDRGWDKPLDPSHIRNTELTPRDVADYIRRKVCVDDSISA